MDPPNIILIVLDTLRKDILPIYGGNANTPNLNELSRDAVVFPNPIAPSPWTLPSHMSIFTGLYAVEHKVHEDPDNGIDKSLKLQYEFKDKTIAKILKKEGYTNIGFSANGWISESSVFSDNFDYFQFQHSAYFTKKDLDLARNFLKIKLTQVISNPNLFKDLYRLYRFEKFNGWPLKKGGNHILQNILNSSYFTPFFLFINFMEMHDPYTYYELRHGYYEDLVGIKPFPDRIIKKMRVNYLKEAKIVDEYIGELIKFLKNIKQYDNSLIIITSDHGQALKEKNYLWHGLFLYNELIEVPLIIKFPMGKKIRISNGYQSLVNLKELIENAVNGNYVDITGEKAFSEAWGFQLKVGENIKKKDNNNYGIPRKAIYKNGYKLVINIEGEIEEFSYKNKKIDPREKSDVVNELKDELYIFKGKENFNVFK